MHVSPSTDRACPCCAGRTTPGASALEFCCFRCGYAESLTGVSGGAGVYQAITWLGDGTGGQIAAGSPLARVVSIVAGAAADLLAARSSPDMPGLALAEERLAIARREALETLFSVDYYEVEAYQAAHATIWATTQDATGTWVRVWLHDGEDARLLLPA